MGATDPGSRPDEGGAADGSGTPSGPPLVPPPVPPMPPVPPPPAAWAAAVPPAGPAAGQPLGPPLGQAFAPVLTPADHRPRSRVTLYTSLAVAGFLAITAATAGTVVALGSPGGGPAAAAAPTVTAAPSPSATPTPTPAPATSAPIVVPTVAPAPTSTVRGTVNDGTHSGDLRFFLLPIPDGGQPINDATGTLETLGVISQEMADPKQGLSALKSWSCSGGAVREYRSSDATLTIRTELLHFDDSADADGWFQGFSFSNGTPFSISGVDDTKGWAFDPSGGSGYGSITGVGYDGDVMYEIDINGQGKLDRSLLTPLMQRERQLLRTGH